MPPKTFPTHFLCIPLASGQLSMTLASFCADVTSPLSFGVPRGAVRPLGTLHLTLGVMCLKEDALERAVALLKTIKYQDIITGASAAATAAQAKTAAGSGSKGATRNRTLSVTLQGLQTMQQPSKTSVLYAPPVDPEGTLNRFCAAVKGVFQEAGLMIDDNRPLLLHATVVNTVYVREKRGGRGGQRRERLTIDAQDIINRYEDYIWMEDMPVNKIAICRMGAKKIEGTDDEAYEVEAEVRL